MLLVGICIGVAIAVAPILIGGKPRPADGLTAGGDARAVASTASPRADATANPRVAPAPQAETDRLARSARRQIAEGRFDAPPGDNALETYRTMMAAAPDAPETERLGRELSALFWHAANEARVAQRPEDALRFFEHLKELPFVPVEALKRTYGAAPLPPERAVLPVEAAPPRAKSGVEPTGKAPPTKADPPASAPAASFPSKR